jgi:hypothetical protein
MTCFLGFRPRCLTLAEELCNVSAACRAMRIERSTRKTLGFATPAEKLTELIDGLEDAGAER